MKVTIKTEGGRNIGMGHLTRCLSIYQAFAEKGIKSSFVINDSPEAKGFLKKNRIGGGVSCERTEMCSDVMIIDSYLTPRDFYVRAARDAGLLVSIDDYKRIDYPAGIVINGSIFADRLGYKKKKEVTYLLGPEYIPLRKSFWEKPERKINAEIKNVLVTLGGFNGFFADKTAAIICGNFNYRVKVVRGVTERGMKKIMLKADVCISGGGQTTYELASTGVPVIGVCFAENQLWNLNGWKTAGFLKFAGWHNDKNIFRNIVKILESLEYAERREMSNAGRKYVDGQGARRVVREIIKHACN